MTKQRFTLEQHAQTGKMLHAALRQIRQLTADLAATYSFRSPLFKCSLKAETAVDELHAALYETLIREHPTMPFHETYSLYWGGDDESRRPTMPETYIQHKDEASFKLERRIGIDGEVKYILLMPLEAFNDNVLVGKAHEFMRALNEWARIYGK